MAVETYYSLLEVSETATAAEIKATYLRLIREIHPDRLANAPAYWQRQAEEKAKEINEAYAYLSNREKRRLYDAQLAAYRGSQGSNSGKSTSQSSASPNANSNQQRSPTGSGPQSTSSGNQQSSQRPPSASPHHQATQASPSSPNVPSYPSNKPLVSRLNSGKRLFFALIGRLLVYGAAGALLLAGKIAFLKVGSSESMHRQVPQTSTPFPDLKSLAERELAERTSTVLLISCDLSCDWKLDGKPQGRIEGHQSTIVSLGLGRHTVIADSTDGIAHFEETIEAVTTAQTSISVKLAPMHAAKLSQYYAVYKDPDAVYLRTLFNHYLFGRDGNEFEYELLSKWDRSYFRSKFIVLSIEDGKMGGVWVNILFQDHPDRVFRAWVYGSGGYKELRAFDSAYRSEQDIERMHRAFQSFLEDKEHAL